MAFRRGWWIVPAACLVWVALGGPARGEVVEEIVAWVNGEIITKSDFEDEEQGLIAEAYRRFSGEELDRKVREVREGLLLQMIDRKILYTQAARLYDLEKMKELFYDSFKEQQKVSSDEEMARLLAAEGMTAPQLKQRLVEMFAPDEVLRFEVRSRVSVSDREVEQYYETHPDEFLKPGEVTLREIVLLARGEQEKERRRAELEAVLQRLAAGEDFAEVAREVSEAGTREAGGLLGPLKQGELAAELERPAFELPVGQLSEPLEMPYGFHLVRVESRTDAQRVSLEEIRDRLRRWMEETKYANELQAYLEKIRSEGEWCVKSDYLHRLSIDPSKQTCQSL